MNSSIQDSTPIGQYDGIKILDALADIGIIDRFSNSPENNQTQFQMRLDADCGSINEQQIQFFKEKFKPDYLEVRCFLDDDNEDNESITVLEMIYGKFSDEEDEN